jgi:hypothetical protein
MAFFLTVVSVLAAAKFVSLGYAASGMIRLMPHPASKAPRTRPDAGRAASVLATCTQPPAEAILPRSPVLAGPDDQERDPS